MTETTRDFIGRAQRYLAAGDLLQASEKGWGAAAEMVKAVAESRGWEHVSHRDLWRAVNRVAVESGDEELRSFFSIAGQLHTNFYEGWLPVEFVEDHLGQVGELLRRLAPLVR